MRNGYKKYKFGEIYISEEKEGMPGTDLHVRELKRKTRQILSEKD